MITIFKNVYEFRIAQFCGGCSDFSKIFWAYILEYPSRIIFHDNGRFRNKKCISFSLFLSLPLWRNISSFYLSTKFDMLMTKMNSAIRARNCFLINADTQQGAYNYFTILLLSDKQDGREVIADYPLYIILAMLCKLPNPLSKLPDAKLEAFVFYSRVHLLVPTYVSVYLHVYAHSPHFLYFV